MTELPWFEVRVGFMAESLADAEDALEALLDSLPFPADFVASIKESPTLSRGEGFGPD